MGTKQQVVAEFRCSEILDAARKVFSTGGYRDATVDDIASAAGLAKATVYAYFPSKQDIYMAALRRGVREMADLTEKEMASAPDGIRAKVEAFLRTRLEFLQDNREFFAVYHAEFGNMIHPASLNKDFRDIYRDQFDKLEAILQEAIDRGELAGVSAETLAILIYESTRGFMLRRSIGWSNATVEEQVDSLMKIIWHGVGTGNVDR